MFNLIRYFSLASAVAIVAVTVILVALYHRHSVNELIASAENGNATLARAFATALDASMAITASGTLGMKAATRSPAATPWARRAAAKLATSA